ncbi:hypothetical protein [Catenulispora rubra]|uniref:hypothetical protein n=1 Tax=Catenulispora rubra TaxID=280293 RepID=UPI0018921DBB|nr:hypothetical protein [Catenulispora rubra]
MTTPTNENRDTDRTEATDSTAPEGRHRLDLSVTKIAASACAAALAAAVGSQLGVAGTIVGAAVASAVATAAGAVIGHSLERGKTAARKARIYEPAALMRVDETLLVRPLTDRAVADHGLDETVVLDRRLTHAATNPNAQTVPLPRITADDAPRTWKDRLPGRKPLIAAAVASFLIGTGAVTALEVARKGEFPGYHSNVFTNGPGQSGGSHNQPAPENSGGNGSHEGTTPSQKPDSSSPSSSGSGSQTPSTTPSTPSTSGSTPSVPSTPSTTSSTGPTGPSTAPTTPPTSNPNPTTAPSSSGASTPSQSATGLGKATPSGGPTG